MVIKIWLNKHAPQQQQKKNIVRDSVNKKLKIKYHRLDLIKCVVDDWRWFNQRFFIIYWCALCQAFNWNFFLFAMFEQVTRINLPLVYCSLFVDLIDFLSQFSLFWLVLIGKFVIINWKNIAEKHLESKRQHEKRVIDRHATCMCLCFFLSVKRENGRCKIFLFFFAKKKSA